MFDLSILIPFATEFVWEHFGIWQRYNIKNDVHNYGNPDPRSKTEPMYAISQCALPFGTLFKGEVYSKSEHDFVWLPSPSERTDELILDTSFTLEEAYMIVTELLKKEIQ